jgi:AraC family transcriptional regulator
LEPSDIPTARYQRGIAVEESSETLCWSSAFASVHREMPGTVRVEARSHHLMISSRSGPGDVTYRIDGQVISRHIRARGLFFLPIGHVCDVTLHTPVESIHLHLDPSLFRDPEYFTCDLGPGLAPLLGEDDGVLQGLLGAIEELVRGDRTGGIPLIADLVTSAIVSRLIAINHDRAKWEGPAKPLRRLSGGHLRKVRQFVEANLASEIELQALAGLCGVGVAHFIRLFKASTGSSPYQYVLGLRVGRAKVLLSDCSLTLADVAQSCGFANQQHLQSTFRRMTGITPGVYRRS